MHSVNKIKNMNNIIIDRQVNMIINIIIIVINFVSVKLQYL